LILCGITFVTQNDQSDKGLEIKPFKPFPTIFLKRRSKALLPKT